VSARVRRADHGRNKGHAAPATPWCLPQVGGGKRSNPFVGRRTDRRRRVHSVLLALSSRPGPWFCRWRGSRRSLDFLAHLVSLAALVGPVASRHLEDAPIARCGARGNDGRRISLVIDLFKYLWHYILAMAQRPLAARLFLSSVVLCAVSVAAFAATKNPPLKPINLNSASSEQLQEVPGIGPATAEKILHMRKAHGPFNSVDDLLAIRGIGRKRLDKMRKYLTAGKSSVSIKSGQSASCPSCAKATTPPAKEAALPVKRIAPAKKAADEPPAPPANEPAEP
jgi:competence ComEA-like helix-hairpin-helix protein